MKSIRWSTLVLFTVISMLFSACGAAKPSGTNSGPIKVLAVESFLADITQNVAGERVKVDTLIPLGTDPHPSSKAIA